MKLLRQIFLEDLGLKVTSLLLGFLLWFQTAGQETVQRTITGVQIGFDNMPSDLIVSNDYLRTADVLIRRPASQPNPEELAIRINMAQARAGEDIRQLSATNVQGEPSWVTVEDVIPPRIRLELEKLIFKSVGIEARTRGQPAEGYQVAEVRLTPSEVFLSGPESRVNAISMLQTIPINISGQSQPFSSPFTIDLADDPLLRIEDTPVPYEALVVVEEERRELTLGTFRVGVRPEGQRARIAPRSVRVTGSVPISFEGELDPAAFAVVVQIPEDGEPLEAGTPLELAPEVVIPEEAQAIFRVVTIEPEVVSVTLR